MGQDTICNIVPCLFVRDREIVYGWFIPLLKYLLMCIFKYPRRVIIRVIILIEFLCYTILFTDKGCLIGCLLSPLWNLPTLFDVLSDIIRTEVKDGQMIKTQ